MFSNDQNIERIADFIEEAKVWFQLRAKSARLTVVEKIVRILTALILFLVLSAVVILFATFVSIAGAIALGHLLDSMLLGFLLVGAVYFALFFVVIIMRHLLIERPLVSFLISILAEDIDTEDTIANNNIKQ